MAVYYNSSGGGSNKNKNSGGDWWDWLWEWWGWLAIVILFCIPSLISYVIAFVLLIKRLRGKRESKGERKRHPYDMQQEVENWEQVTWEKKAEHTAPPAGEKKKAEKKAASKKSKKTSAPGKGRKTDGEGRGLTVAGAILAGAFGYIGVCTFVEALNYGGLRYELTGIVTCLMMMLCGLGMLGTGIGQRRRHERYMNYLAYIGANREVSLAHMAATFDVPVKKLCKDLRRMLSRGILPTGYLDLAEGRLFLTEMGYRAPEPPKEQKAEKPSEEEENAILREIRQINDDIPGEEMSEKIDRIEEITRKILNYQKEHPDREGQLRSFLSYYLPTTLKILRAYAQLDAQGIEGENISAAKARIEGMMDQVVAGFEKQLDRLFQDDALDITSDVAVLENMLRKDGLSDGQGMTLEM